MFYNVQVLPSQGLSIKFVSKSNIIFFQASARRVGLKKLLDWILSVMALSLVPWRLVIGDNNSIIYAIFAIIIGLLIMMMIRPTWPHRTW